MTSDLLEENQDLRKQVADLKEQLEKHKWNNIFLEDCAVYDKEIAEEYKTLQERIADLEKENAELKSIADFQTSSNMDRYFQLKRSKEQLTKAKDIIRDYKIVVEGDHTTVCSVPEENRCINVLKLNEQAEQFLSEVEK